MSLDISVLNVYAQCAYFIAKMCYLEFWRHVVLSLKNAPFFFKSRNVFFFFQHKGLKFIEQKLMYKIINDTNCSCKTKLNRFIDLCIRLYIFQFWRSALFFFTEGTFLRQQYYFVNKLSWNKLNKHSCSYINVFSFLFQLECIMFLHFLF